MFTMIVNIFLLLKVNALNNNMEVTVEIKNISCSIKYDKLEFIYKDKLKNVDNLFSFKVSNFHDFLFEKIIINFISKVFPLNKIIGKVLIRNSFFKKSTKKKCKVPIMASSYAGKTCFYDFNGIEQIGYIIFDYHIEQCETDDVNNENDNFIQKILNIFISQQKSELLFNLKFVINELLKGSHQCQINFFLGMIYLERYTAKIHYNMTKNLTFEDVKNLKKLNSIFKEDSNRKKSEFYLENFLLGNSYKFEYVKISDFTDYDTTTHDGEHYKKLLDYNAANKKLKNYETNLKKSANFLNFFKGWFHNEENMEITLTILNKDSNKLNIYTQTVQSFNHLKINYDEIFKKPQKIYNIKNILDNSNYIIANNFLLDEIINKFYYAIAAYGNQWPTIFCTKRKKIKNDVSIDKNRKAILEYLDIENENLLVVSMNDNEVPHHIIFLENFTNRLVVSFKGTSSSDEILKDLNCRYTKFYEGYTHTGMKHLACLFVEKHTEDLKKFAQAYHAKEILFTGHSLGGSIASLLYIIYTKQNLLQDFNITTLAFSPTPIVSYNLLENSYKNLYIINYGNDCVPRLNFGSVAEIKYQACSLGNAFNFLNSLENIEDSLKKIQNYTLSKNMFPKLYCPGNLYQFKRINVQKRNKQISLILYKKVDPEFYNDIMVIKHVTVHHMLAHVLNVFKKGVIDWKEINTN